jgi:hypothetical protein
MLPTSHWVGNMAPLMPFNDRLYYLSSFMNFRMYYYLKTIISKNESHTLTFIEWFIKFHTFLSFIIDFVSCHFSE